MYIPIDSVLVYTIMESTSTSDVDSPISSDSNYSMPVAPGYQHVHSMIMISLKMNQKRRHAFTSYITSTREKHADVLEGVQWRKRNQLRPGNIGSHRSQTSRQRKRI